MKRGGKEQKRRYGEVGVKGSVCGGGYIRGHCCITNSFNLTRNVSDCRNICLQAKFNDV